MGGPRGRRAGAATCVWWSRGAATCVLSCGAATCVWWSRRGAATCVRIIHVHDIVCVLHFLTHSGGSNSA